MSQPNESELHRLSAVELALMLRARQVSAREVVADHLAQVERWNPVVNAVVTLTGEQAMEAAAAADEAAARGQELGPLHGLPTAHKDLQDTRGVRTTYGSPLFAEHVPDADSLLVQRVRAAGAISLGKTNVPEFGAGSQTYNAVFGETRNPWDPRTTPGGSSGGAAAALAARMVPLADGSDLGGSLRNPASFCNVVGLRPSAGLVPSWPSADAYFPLPVDGPMARTVADVALLLSVLAGFDARDPRSWPGDGARFARAALTPGGLDVDTRRLRVAWWPRPDGLPVDRRVVDVLERDGRRVLEELGAQLLDAGPDLRGADQVFRVLRAWQFAAAHGETYRRSRDELGDSVAWNVEQGLDLTGADVAAAFRARTEIYARTVAFMADVDVVAMPVSQVPPFPVEQRWVTEIDGQQLASYLDWMASCYLITVTGLPAVSVPCGFTADGLPVGLQLVGRPQGELELLRVAHAVETAAGASLREPVLPEPVDRMAAT